MFGRETDSYRRGLTLGLTMAEIFILILFLFLLVLLALYAVNNKIEKKLEVANQNFIELQKEKSELQEELWEIYILHTDTIKKIVRLSAVNAKLTTERNEAQAAESITMGQWSDIDKRLEAVTDELNRTKKLLLEAQKDLPKNIEKLVQKLNATEEKLAGVNRQLNSSQNEIAEMEAKQQVLQQENAQLLANLYANKGIDPPCWYSVESQDGKHREKPHYLMDIAVHNDHLRVRLRPAPRGRAIYEKGQSASTSYAEEHATLPLEPLTSASKISLGQFSEITKPIRHMGKEMRIREYACVFYVKVWDLTEKTAKDRWKLAENVIKQSFYTYSVVNDPWE